MFRNFKHAETLFLIATSLACSTSWGQAISTGEPAAPEQIISSAASPDARPLNFQGLPLLDSDEFSRYADFGGREIWVAGEISEIFQHPSGMIFINFTELRNGITAVVYPKDTPAWQGLDLDTQFKGKFVIVRSTLGFFKNRAQITVTNPNQLVIIDGGWDQLTEIAKPAPSAAAPPESPTPATKP